MAPDEKYFEDIDGVPTMYMRSGDGVRRPAGFRCTYGFYDQLVAWVRYLKAAAAAAGPEYATMEWITSAGAYVNKSGQHGLGTAFDLDEVKFVDGPLIAPIARPQDSADPLVRRRYYALDAMSRTHFRWCLDAHYNAAHEDHIHQDFGGMPPVLSPGSSSDTRFVQGMLNEFQGAGLAVDGIWGPLTQGAFDESVDRLGYAGDPHGSTEDYRRYLDVVAANGFAGTDFSVLVGEVRS